MGLVPQRYAGLRCCNQRPAGGSCHFDFNRLCNQTQAGQEGAVSVLPYAEKARGKKRIFDLYAQSGAENAEIFDKITVKS